VGYRRDDVRSCLNAAHGYMGILRGLPPSLLSARRADPAQGGPPQACPKQPDGRRNAKEPNSMRIVRCLSLGATLGSSGLLGSVVPALAQMPQPWQLNLQHAATPVMERLYDFHTFLLWIISAIALFVFGLLLFVIVRFRENISPVPSRATHHTLVEVRWTVVPVLILVVIAIPSFRILYYSDWIEEADMTIKAIGHQWYWSYEYPDNGNFTFDAVLTPENELKPGQIRLLETDKRLVLPVDTTIRVLVTADDVIHSWSVPSFGVKRDAIPGRINETWIRIEREGTYYGQCAQLCGQGHAFMPITVEVVSKDAFKTWVQEAQAKFAQAPGETVPAIAATMPPALGSVTVVAEGLNTARQLLPPPCGDYLNRGVSDWSQQEPGHCALLHSG
jgi:cytochrome c oxidase subunit II